MLSVMARSPQSARPTTTAPLYLLEA
jgi:hypothetical protein